MAETARIPARNCNKRSRKDLRPPIKTARTCRNPWPLMLKPLDPIPNQSHPMMEGMEEKMMMMEKKMMMMEKQITQMDKVVKQLMGGI